MRIRAKKFASLCECTNCRKISLSPKKKKKKKKKKRVEGGGEGSGGRLKRAKGGGCWRRYGGRRGWRRDALAPSSAETLRWCWLHVPTHLKPPGVDPSPPRTWIYVRPQRHSISHVCTRVPSLLSPIFSCTRPSCAREWENRRIYSFFNFTPSSMDPCMALTFSIINPFVSGDLPADPSWKRFNASFYL